jgi:hypothetical protein
MTENPCIAEKHRNGCCSYAPAGPRFTAVMRPATLRADGSLCVFRAGVIDTDVNRIVYVASRDACRDFAKRLNAEFAPGTPTDLAGESFPLHATYATEDESFAAMNAADAARAAAASA